MPIWLAPAIAMPPFELERAIIAYPVENMLGAGGVNHIVAKHATTLIDCERYRHGGASQPTVLSSAQLRVATCFIAKHDRSGIR
jgi:hypothetical protein